MLHKYFDVKIFKFDKKDFSNTRTRLVISEYESVFQIAPSVTILGNLQLKL